MNNPVQLTSNITGGTAPYTYFWKFFDNNSTSNADKPVHVFIKSGNQQVSLRVIDSIGCSGITARQFNVVEISIEIEYDSILCLGDKVTFTPLIYGGQGPYTYNWDFGDGATEDVEISTHAYIAADNYKGSLQVADKNGCIGNKPFNVKVDDLAINLTTTPTSCCDSKDASASVLIINSSSSVNYFWGNNNKYNFSYPYGDTTNMVLNLERGSYYVNVSNNGCSIRTDVVIKLDTSDYDIIGRYVVRSGTAEVWNSDKNIIGTVTIENGAELTIEKGVKIQMSHCGEEAYNLFNVFHVQSGGKLIVNGGIISGNTKCNIPWDGIIVEGNVSVKHPSNGYIKNNPHGFAHIKNGAVIMDAWLGICTGCFGQSNGMIWVDNSNFINNRTSIFFNASNFITKSRIYNSYFEHSDYGIRGRFDEFVSFQSIRGLQILDNRFVNLSATANLNNRGTGIRSLNSAFEVGSIAQTATVSTTTGKGNTFVGLTKGIDAYSSGGLSENIIIKDNIFDSVRQGIIANGSNFDEISHNKFLNIPRGHISGTDTFATWGIYMYNTTGFTIHSNEFYGNHIAGTVNAYNPTYGVIARYTGEFGNQIYDNKFYNIPYSATQPERHNPGLQIKCNIYTDNQEDWTVTGNPNIDKLARQGSCLDKSTPAGNEFSRLVGGSCVAKEHIESVLDSVIYNHHIQSSLANAIIVRPKCVSLPELIRNQCPFTKNAGSCPEFNNGVVKDGISKGQLPPDIVNEVDPISKELLISALIRKHLQEAVQSPMVIIPLLENMQKLDAKKILVPTFLAEKEFGKCRQTLNDIPYDTPENMEFHKLFDHIVNYCEQGKNLEDMTEFDKQPIREVAETGTRTAVYAEAYLVELEKKEYHRVPLRMDKLNNQAVPKTQNLSTGLAYNNGEKLSPFIHNNPNPFNGITTIEAFVPGGYLNSKILISDILGRVIKTIDANLGYNSIEMSLDEFEKGIYFLQLNNNDKRIAKHKMVLL